MRILPIAFPAILVALWQFGVSRQSSPILPGPWSVVTGLAELIHKGVVVQIHRRLAVPRHVGIFFGSGFGNSDRFISGLAPPSRVRI